jgi:hypothetical protein
MRRYFLETHGERHTDETPTGRALPDERAAMLRAVTMGADTTGVTIGRVSVVAAIHASARRDA